VTPYPLLYLTVRSVRNRIRVRLQRLREPRYLIATILGAAYFAFFIIGPTMRRGAPRMMPSLATLGAVVQHGVAFFGFVTAALAWFWPLSTRPALPFTRAEVTHLFTAPIPRRQLVRYRVLRSQLGVLFGSLIVTLFLRPGGVANALPVVLGLAIFMATMNFHTTAVSLTRASHGIRRTLPRIIGGAAVLIVLITFAMHWTALKEMAAGGGKGLAAEIARLCTTGAAGVVLWPFMALGRVPIAETFQQLMLALPWALLVLALNYIWVVRMDVPIEEASAELSEKVEKIRQQGLRALRKPPTSRRTPFALAARGRHETAILWKNLISMSRVLSWTVLLRFAPLFVVFTIGLSRGRRGPETFLAFVSLFAAGFAVILGPQMVRNDLRQDLAALAVLKTWPVRGAALLRGEILAPAIVLVVIASLAVIAAGVFATDATFAARITERWSLVIAALLVIPGVVLAQLLAQNALAVTFPSWTTLGPRQAGVDVMGQRLLVMIAILLALVVSLLPAALVAGIGSGMLYLLTGRVWPVVPGALAGATLLVEVFVGSELIGAILDRTDISAVDVQES
jgi:hypothetical protein